MSTLTETSPALRYPIEKWERYTFGVLLLLWLIPIWSVHFFVTGDGPCHLYNSKILLDWFNPDIREFYEPFYSINPHFEPNWLYNLLTMPLLAITSPAIAEKIFFTFYVLAFGLGFRYLISRINPAAKFLSSLGLILVYNKLLMAGFLNNSLSIALSFWVVGYWYSQRDRLQLLTGLKIAGLLLLVYSAHPMGYFLAGAMMLAVIAGDGRNTFRTNGKAAAIQQAVRQIVLLALAALPSLVLLGSFLLRNNWQTAETKQSLGPLLESIIRLSSIQLTGGSEKHLTTALSLLCLGLVIGAVVLRRRNRALHAADGLGVLALLVLYSIISPFQGLTGGLEVPMRTGVILYPLLLLWSATARFPEWLKRVTVGAAFLLSIKFLDVRLLMHWEASGYASEVNFYRHYIADQSTVLVLNYDWEGHAEDGGTMNSTVTLFNHVDCYLGTGRSLIISDNYEAHFSYFPVNVRWETDMYSQTDKDGINFDHRPPRADILSYHRRTQQEIDYVLILGYFDEEHPYTREIMEQLAEAFEPVLVSEPGRVVELYKRRNRGTGL